MQLIRSSWSPTFWSTLICTRCPKIFYVMFFLRNIVLGIINLNTQEHILPTTSCSSTTNNNNKSSTLWLVCMSSWRVRASDYVIESGMTQLRDRNLGLNSGLLCLTWKFTGSMAWPLKNGSSTQINIYSLGIFFLLSCINIYLSIYQSEKCWVLLITMQTLEKTGLKRRKGGSHFIIQKRCHIIQSWKRANLFGLHNRWDVAVKLILMLLMEGVKPNTMDYSKPLIIIICLG